MCQSCLKDVKIIAKGLCKSCYYRSYNKKPKTSWWKSVVINSNDKEQIRLSLLRYKWSYETAIDAMTLIHFYLKYKSEKMANFEPFGVEWTISKVKAEMKKIFK